ncbi:MAG TPA: hypothetical protein VIO11_01760, partial [Candidatus Methanoperedens sp.]
EQIIRDINLTKAKLDLSWNKYREGDFQISYNLINEIDNEIADIGNRIDRCALRSPAPQFMLILIAFVLAIIVTLYNRSRRK